MDAPNTKSHLLVIGVTALCAVSCGATFLFALFRQFGLVEVAASLSTGAEVYFLSSAIGDLLEDRPQPNRKKLTAAVCLAIAVVAYFLVMRMVSGRGA